MTTSIPMAMHSDTILRPGLPAPKYGTAFAVATRYFDLDDPHLWTHVLHPHDRREAPHYQRDSCLDCGQTVHSVWRCEDASTKAHQR